MSETNCQVIKDTTANPAPLGLLAFGMTTILLNFHNSGVYELNSMILAMGLFYGGTAQVIAGIMEWKKNNTFGLTAFASYGSFWLTLVGLLVMPKLGWVAATSPMGMACYLALWGVFTLFLFIGTLRLSKALQVVFGTLVVLFFLLAIGDAMESATVGAGASIKRIAGYEGLFCGVSAVYTGMAQVLNEVYGKTVMPLGAVKK